MRIAQVAPLFESCPPRLYGGTERVVSYLTEQLVADGHDVTLFASRDSRTGARLVPGAPQALRLSGGHSSPGVWHTLMLERVARYADQFDLIHFHTDYLHLPLTRRLRVPTISTLHGRLDLTEVAALYSEFAEVPVVSISDSQRTPLPGANWVATVYHGIPVDHYALGPGDGGYLAFLGRISPEKRPDLAIRIAHEAGMELRMAAKVDAADRAYFEDEIRPLLDAPNVSLIGEIGEKEKGEFLGRAAAMLFPIDWPEPFGLVMIEAMACGTPVIAFPRASVPEVVDHGLTGYLVGGIGEAIQAVRHLRSFDRARCRATFEARFSAQRMAQDYLGVYHAVAAAAASRGPL